jgi:hypothetical protein
MGLVGVGNIVGRLLAAVWLFFVFVFVLIALPTFGIIVKRVRASGNTAEELCMAHAHAVVTTVALNQNLYATLVAVGLYGRFKVSSKLYGCYYSTPFVSRHSKPHGITIHARLVATSTNTSPTDEERSGTSRGNQIISG